MNKKFNELITKTKCDFWKDLQHKHILFEKKNNRTTVKYISLDKQNNIKINVCYWYTNLFSGISNIKYNTSHFDINVISLLRRASNKIFTIQNQNDDVIVNQSKRNHSTML